MSKSKEEAIKYVKKEKRIFQIQNILNQVIISNASNDLKIQSEKLH
jgi:hypothetical protein